MRNSFVLYEQWGTLIDSLSNENKGVLFQAVYDYIRDKDIEIEDPVLCAVFDMFRAKLDEDGEKYQKVCEQRAEAGKKGGSSKPKQKQANANKSKQMLTKANKSKQTEADNDNDSDNEYVNEDVTDGEKDKKHLARSSPDGDCEPEADTEPIPLNTGEGWRPKISQYNEYCRLYPNADVMQEFRGMRAWCLSNPTKRKTRSGITRFVNSWLSKAQNSGGARSPTQKGYDWDNL